MQNGNLKSQVFNGAKWSAIERVLYQLIQFLVSVILARLILPEAFGIMGMVLVIVGFVNMIADTGFAGALVQRKELTEQHIYSVFWVSLTGGFLLTGLTFACAPLIAEFYDQPDLLTVSQGMALTFLLSAIGMVPNAILQRQMAFRSLAIIRIISTLISGLMAVMLAFSGAGIWALIVQVLVYNLLGSLLSFFALRWYPRFIFRIQSIQELWGYTINLFGWNFLNYWARNTDNLLIGRFLSSADLGYYSRTYALMLMPMYQFVNVFAKVIFPALASIQDEPTRIKHICLRAISVFSVVVTPIMIGLVVTAESFVLSVYGIRWSSMVPLLQILAPVGLIQTFTSPISWIYTATGRTDLLFHWGIISSSVMIASIVLGILRGSVEAVAWCYLIANCALFYPAYRVAGKLIGLHFRDLTRAILGPLTASVIMAGIVHIFSLTIPDDWTNLSKFTMLVLVGGGTYMLLLLVLRPSGWREVVLLLKNNISWFVTRKL